MIPAVRSISSLDASGVLSWNGGLKKQTRSIEAVVTCLSIGQTDGLLGR